MAEPKQDSAPTCEYLNVHEDAVARVLAALPDDETLYDLSELFRVFGDSTRIKILYVLFESELCVCDIARLLNLTQSAVSHQLRILKASNLVRFRRGRPCSILWTTTTSGPCWPSAWSMFWKNDGQAIVFDRDQ